MIPGNAVESSELPPLWRHLPSLALPDGSHNFEEGGYIILMIGNVNWLACEPHVHIIQLTLTCASYLRQLPD